ncbi:MAG: sulfotransferase [Leptolyngbyaceae bacterium]|nr:sulfotransferase [Leptolyngbyaceae bacterium]
MTPPWSPRLLHPLIGSDITTLIQVLVKNGGVAPRCWPHAVVAIATALARLPISALESQRLSRLRQQAPAMPPPIFIVGHWRSGTTFLYELLCQSPQFHYVSPFATGIPWDFLTITQWFQPFLEQLLPQDRFIDQVQVKADSPQEDEIALASMQPLSFYHGLYFPSRLQQNLTQGLFFEDCSPGAIERWRRAMVLFMEKLHLQSHQQQLLIKNPVYTARIKELRSLFPNAKFIHIYRNPYIVFQSTRNFYIKLFRELALQSPATVDINQLDTLIFNCYSRMMQTLQQDGADLPPTQFIELQFETFESDPVGHIERIYAQLDIGGFETARPFFERYVGDRQTYRKNRYQFSQNDNNRVYEQWQPFIDHWDYTPPTS